MPHCSEFTTGTHREKRSHVEIHLAVHLERRLQRLMVRPIRVHICENELQLFGQVASWYEKQQAQEAARALAPMCRIRNELRVSHDAVLSEEF